MQAGLRFEPGDGGGSTREDLSILVQKKHEFFLISGFQIVKVCVIPECTALSWFGMTTTLPG